MTRDDNSKTQPSLKGAVHVWDFPTRTFHWLLVALIAFEWASVHLGGRFMTYHMWGGDAVLTLLVFRLAWGFVGSRTARFSHFVRSPRQTLAYIRSWRNRATFDGYGHNPVGGWAVGAFLVSLSIQVGTGLFATDDILTEGPLNPLIRNKTADFLTHIHKLNFDFLLALMATHIIAVVLHKLVGGHDLVRPMITGRAPRERFPEHTHVRFAHPWIGVLTLGVAVATTWLIVHL